MSGCPWLLQLTQERCTISYGCHEHLLGAWKTRNLLSDRFSLSVSVSLPPFPFILTTLLYINGLFFPLIFVACMYIYTHTYTHISKSNLFSPYSVTCFQGWLFGVALLFPGRTTESTPSVRQLLVVLWLGLRPCGLLECSLGCSLVSSLFDSPLGRHVGETWWV